MDGMDTLEVNRSGWDTISAAYQAERRILTDDVHYGPLAPGERELGLLGDVSGKQIIEIGCGGGQNSIALARWGADCIGVDPSRQQLAHAERLAQENGVEVHFAAATAEDLGVFPDSRFDIALSSYAFDYVSDLPQAYREAWRVLKEQGALVFCLSHPWFQAVGWHLSGDPDAAEVGDYADWPHPEVWDWRFENGTSARFRGHLRSLEQIVNELVNTGFVLERLLEQNVEDITQSTAEELARLPYLTRVDPDSLEYQVMRKLPHTLVVRARKASAPGSNPGAI